jgi:hypothetical protein
VGTFTERVERSSSLKFRVFWDVAPYSHVEVDRHFRGAYCLHHQGDEIVFHCDKIIFKRMFSELNAGM